MTIRIALATAALVAASASAPAEDLLEFVEFYHDSDPGITGFEWLYSFIPSADNKFAYSGTIKFNYVGVFSRDESTGAIAQIQVLQADMGPAVEYTGPHISTMSRDGRNVYYPLYYGDSFMGYARDTATGLLTQIQRIDNEPAGDNDMSGAFAPVESPDGRFLYVPAHKSHCITIFSRDLATGMLTKLGRLRQADMPEASALADPQFTVISADGRFLYTAGYANDCLTVFARDETTGALSHVQSIHNGDGPLQHFDGPRWLAIPSDGRNLYATGLFGASLASFSRNEATGELVPIAEYHDPDRLMGVRCVEVSPDGRMILANGYDDGYLLQFSRPASGIPAFRREYRNDPSAGIFGCQGTREVRFSPDGKFLYLASWDDWGVAVWRTVSTADVESWQLL